VLPASSPRTGKHDARKGHSNPYTWNNRQSLTQS
jgi:hypothetical protein